MNISILLSVIIPVFNTERYIEKAILSALQQSEVTEIIVINDGSTDGTACIIEKLQQRSPIVKVYKHPNGVNKGRAASRNLGLVYATGKYIAFLDADDYYLENRFTNDLKVFANNDDCEGVYNAVGFDFYRVAKATELTAGPLYTVNREIAPADLFKNLLFGTCGHFHIDGLTVKRTVFHKTGNFKEALVVAEDTDLLWKMAIKSRLFTGVIDHAIAKRGVHENNIFDNEQLYQIYTIKMHESVAIWASKNNVSNEIIDDILKWIWMVKQKENNTLGNDINYWSRLFLPNRQLLFSMLSIKYFPMIRYRQVLFPFLYNN